MQTTIIEQLQGKTLLKVEQVSDDEIQFITNDYRIYSMHSEDGSPNDVEVRVESIVGDLQDLIGTPILKAEYVSNVNEEGLSPGLTWTFIKFATVKGYVDIRYTGQSNGYYAEAPIIADFGQVSKEYVEANNNIANKPKFK